MKRNVLFLRDLFHGPFVEALFVADLPDPSEAAESDLVVKFVGFELVPLFNYHLTVS